MLIKLSKICPNCQILNVDDFFQSQVLPLGKPGGGAPNRTESGRVVTKIQADNHIRLQAHRDGRPIDSLPQVKTRALSEPIPFSVDFLLSECMF